MPKTSNFRLLPKWTFPALIAGVAVVFGFFVWVKPTLFSSQYISDATQRTFIQPPSEIPGTPEFFKLPERNPVHLDQWRGRYLLVYFWATWCPPCVGELPTLHQLAMDWKEAPLTILPVHLDEDFDPGQVELFWREFQIEIPAYVDINEELEKALQLEMVPVTYLIDPEGRVRVIHRGPEDWTSEELRKHLSGQIGWRPENR